MVSPEVFKGICDRISVVSCTELQLNLIKDHFRNGIDSPRRFDRILNLNSLISVLKKRDVLNEEDITPLDYIASILGVNNLIWLNVNNQQIRHEVPIFSEQPMGGRVLPQVSQEPIQRVDDMICTEIGQKWNDFARHLKVPEGFIDELEHRHLRISDMVREVLRYHRDICDERYWRINLCEGLRKARRTDLSLRVEEVFARFGLM